MYSRVSESLKTDYEIQVASIEMMYSQQYMNDDRRH